MRAVLSPYELHEWSPAAAAALWLFDSTTTARPEPAHNTPIRRRDAPALAELLERWAWSAPLWNSGLLTPDADAASGFAEARMMANALRDDPRLGPIQRLTTRPWSDDQTDAAEALARDLLAPQSSPAIQLPVIAALEAMALRAGAVLCRAEGQGIISHLERRAGSLAILRLAIPALIGADGQRWLDARDRLTAQREALAQAVHNALSIASPSANASASEDPQPSPQHHSVTEAATELHHAFMDAYRAVPPLTADHAEDGPRRTILVVSITSATPTPTLNATARFASIVGGRSHQRALAARTLTGTSPTTPPTHHDATATDRLLIATIKRARWQPII